MAEQSNILIYGSNKGIIHVNVVFEENLVVRLFRTTASDKKSINCSEYPNSSIISKGQMSL